MKLPELVKRFEKKYTIRIVAGVLVVALIGSGVSVYDVRGAKADGKETAQTTEQEEEEQEQDTADVLKDKLGETLDKINIEEKVIGKEETVYVIADSTGKAKEIIVSDHLHNGDGAKTIEDVSTLRDIENVKGDETFSQNGDNVTWQADGNDIYYQGTATAEPPVGQQITYYLNGEAMKPEELAGKSGEVTIRFEYTNSEKVKTEIDGKEAEVCVPFVAVSGMVLNENFTNVKVSNGKVIEDGNKTMVVGYTLPGLKESLDVEDSDFDGDVTIPDYLEITADVEEFELGMTMTVVANAMDFLNMDNVTDFSDADELVDTLTDAVGQLADGSEALAEGTGTLRDKMGEFSDGVSTLRKGVSDYTDGAKRLADGISTFKNSVPTLSTGVTTLNSSAASISAGVALLDKTLNTAFTENEKKDMAKTVTDTLAKQEKSIKKSAAESVKAQEGSIKSQAEAAVDAQAADIKSLAEGTVDAQAAGIKAQAEGAVDAQAAGIKAQAEGTVDAQAAGIKAQAEGAVDAQAEGISAQAVAGVTAQADTIKSAATAGVAAQKETLENAAAASVQQKAEEIKNQAVAGVNAQADTIQAAAVDSVNQAFASQNYAYIKGEAQQSFSEKMTNADTVNAVASSLAQNEQIANMVAQAALTEGMRAQLTAAGITDEASMIAYIKGTPEYQGSLSSVSQMLASSVLNGVVAVAGDAIGTSVADTAQTVAQQTAGTAALAGAQGVAGTVAVAAAEAAAKEAAYAGAQGVAGDVALAGAQGVAGTVAQSAAKAAAGTAAVSGAKAAAGTAAVSGAKAAAGTAAVSGAKAAAGTAAVSGAAEAAKEAAYAGAMAAAPTAAISAAEQTKQTIASSIEAAGANGYSLVTGSAALAAGTQSLADAMPNLINGVEQLYSGSQTLVGNNTKLNDGTKSLAEGTDAVIEGVGKLDDGANELADGVLQFNEEGIEKILNSFDGDIEPLMDRLQAIIDAGNSYQSYTSVADGVIGSVKFVYRTEAVVKEDE